MRGERVFTDIIKDNSINTVFRRGRSNTLVSRRNECLVARCYYWSSVKHKSYEEVIRQLVTEFFLSPPTIVRLLQESASQLVTLKQKCPALYYLQNRWPHLKW